jgi:Tfp pilus assembly protein PilF
MATLPVLAAEPAGLATVIEFQGRVEISRAGSNAWDPAYTNQVLHTGDRYRTGERSQLLLRMFDRTHLRVGERSVCLLQLPEEEEDGIVATFIRGIGYFFGRDQPDKVLIRSTTASAAVRGTEFVVQADEDGRLVVTLIDGSVELSNDQGTVNLESGERGEAVPGSPPVRTPVVQAEAEIQWLLYYPAVLDLEELSFDQQQRDELDETLRAYQSGDLIRAMESYPNSRRPTNDSERAYRAMLLLSVGDIDQTRQTLQSATNERAPGILAVRELLSVVVGNDPILVEAPERASEWLARSLRQQQDFDLPAALTSARTAVGINPRFGFAWARVAELEFSSGRAREARIALERTLELTPRNAQALALLGFVRASEDDLPGALAAFDQAIAIDDRLGNAWLGRGLVRIRLGDRAAGLADLQVAAVMEPNRSLLRSYLAKAFGLAGDVELALHELELARNLDPNDPTPRLYEGLLRRQRNEINTSLRDLEESVRLNENRRVYRSRLLLDQDLAVRSAHLAGVYLDLEMRDLSLREAARAVDHDYANFSAHQFLAQSYNALRDPRQINLRYETPAFTEYLLSNLLAPPGAGSLSQNISQNEYARLFDRDGLGFSSDTQYLGSGDWRQNASQFGNFGDFGYALDVFYQTENGQRANADLDQIAVSFAAKYAVAPKDQLLVTATWYEYESGDVAPRYDPADALTGLRVNEVQEPLLTAGWRHEWSPGQITLAAFSYADQTIGVTNAAQPTLLIGRNPAGQVTLINQTPTPLAPLDYEGRFRLYSGEAQHLWESARHTLIVGGRVQTGTFDTASRLGLSTPTILNAANRTNPVPGTFSTPATAQSDVSSMNRFTGYVYEKWKVLDSLQLIGGIAYDYLEYPVNHRNAPLWAGETSTDQWSPKAGFNFEPFTGTVLRGAYSRFLGGVSRH